MLYCIVLRGVIYGVVLCCVMCNVLCCVSTRGTEGLCILLCSIVLPDGVGSFSQLDIA